MKERDTRKKRKLATDRQTDGQARLPRGFQLAGSGMAIIRTFNTSSLSTHSSDWEEQSSQ